MSSDEVREYCRSLCSFKVRAQVQFKYEREVMCGTVTEVLDDSFQLTADDDSVRTLRYVWVARVRHA